MTNRLISIYSTALETKDRLPVFKAVTTKLKFLREILMVILILTVLQLTLFIFFLIRFTTYNNAIEFPLPHYSILFNFLIPTIDKKHKVKKEFHVSATLFHRLEHFSKVQNPNKVLIQQKVLPLCQPL